MTPIIKLRLWAKRNPLILAIMGVLFLSGLPFVLPPHHTSFSFQRELQLLGVVIWGPIASQLVAITQTSWLPSFYSVALLLFLVIMIGFLVSAIGRMGALAVWLALGLAIINTGCGIFYARFFWSGHFNTVMTKPCERWASDMRGIRIVAYYEREKAWPLGSYFFVLSTADGGETWEQIMEGYLPANIQGSYYAGLGAGDQLFCPNIGVRDESFYWVWAGPMMTVTHDGGTSWHYWHFPAWRYGYNDILNVELEPGHSGFMGVSRFPNFHSQDGGITWYPLGGG